MENQELLKLAKDVRKEIIKMLEYAGSGHSAGSLGIVEILVCLYFSILNHDPTTPNWDDRDRFILSMGHACPALYTVLAFSGYFPKSELKSLRKINSRLQGHPQKGLLPGIETTSGPLGCGLAQAAGMALAGRMDAKRFRVFCLVSDGEQDEGNHWEAVMFAAKYKLGNLTVFLDKNNIQLSGFTKDIMPIDPIADKYRSFNWNVEEINGHSFEEIKLSVDNARMVYERPTVIIANTIPGRGVSFMENNPDWHGKVPDKDQAKQALEELRND